MDETNASDETLFNLVEEITNKLHAGDVIDLDAYADRYPAYIERLRAVLPSLELLADFGSSERSQLLTSPVTIPDHSGLDILGDYQILREVGRGGMGVVYESTHRLLGRRVALKVLPLAAMVDPRQIQRFKNESQAVSHLDHPHIVDVFGVGCDRGVHYYAMRFIEGRTLSEMIRGLREGSNQKEVDAGAETPRNRDASTSEPANTISTRNGHPGSTKKIGDSDSLASSWVTTLSEKHATRKPAYFRSVAELIWQAADALEHAHRQNIIHRDIKPSNLMLEDTGKLWVTDFGLAHVEGAATLTMTGDVVGTLRYMSPEQAKGMPVDHRSDVYSLGATLYELLTLSPAFPQHDRHQLFQKIATEDPIAPRRLNRAIPSDLETIVLKSLQKEPGQRYQSAASLASDLRCFVEYRPITARPPTLMDRAVKWSRRHRSIVGAAVAVVLISIVSLVVATAFMARVASVAVAERHEASLQRNRAIANERLALQALDEMFMEVFENRFPSDQLTATDHALLEKALGFYQGFAHQNETEPASRFETAKAYRRVGDIQMRLARSDDAEENYRRSIEYYEALARDFPDEPEFVHGIATSTNNLGQSLQAQEAFDGAEEAYRQVLVMESGLASEFGTRPRYREELARASNNLGVLLVALKRVEDAAEAFRTSRDRWQSLADSYTDHAEYSHHLATSHVNLANLWLENEQQDRAHLAIDQAVQIARGLTDVAQRPQYTELLARSLNSLGALWMREGHRGESEPAFREAVPLWQSLADRYVNVPEYREEVVRSSNNLGSLLRDETEASDWLERASVGLESLVQQFPERRQYREQLAETYDRLGTWYRDQEEPHRACDAYVDAARCWEELNADASSAPEYPQRLADLYNRLGILYSTSGRPDDAKSAYNSALRALDQISGEQAKLPEHRNAIASLCHNLGLIVGIDEVEQAERLLRRGRSEFSELRRRAPANPSYLHSLASSHTALGNLLFDTERRTGAEVEFRCALALREALAQQFSNVAALQNSLAWLLVSCADSQIRDAERGLDCAQAAVRLAPGERKYLNTLGVAQYCNGQYEAAIESLEGSLPAGSPARAPDCFFIAMSYHQLGNGELARLHYERGYDWMKANRPNDIELKRFQREASSLLEPPSSQ